MKIINTKLSRWIVKTPLCVLFTFIVTSALMAQTQPSFVAHKEFVAIPTVGNPGKLTQGDLNGDGIADLVIPEGDFLDATMHVAIVLGNPDGTFQAPVSFDTGAPSNIGFLEFATVIADFNSDGKNDIAVTTLNGVSILLGDGKGGFGAPQIFRTGTLPLSLVAGDFNGDGKIDLAVANAGTNDVSILLGKGDGTFTLARTLPVGLGPEGIAIGDFNGDGHPDLAVTNSNQVFANQGANGNTVAILLGTGNGGFKPALFTPVAAGPIGVAVADLNLDHKEDIVVTNSGTDQVSVLLGNGNGTFRTPTTFTVQSGPRPNDGYAPSHVAVNDFNGDGNPDLVITSPNTSTATILLGDGKGNLGKPTNFLVAAAPAGVVTGDYNHDGHPGFITVGNASGTLSVFLGKGNGKFVVELGFPAPTRADQVVVADFNEDGTPDIATANAGLGSKQGNTVSVALGKKGGGFAKEDVITPGENPLSLAVGDFNRDGHLDLVVANSATQLDFNGSLSIILGNGDGTFQPPHAIKIIENKFPVNPNFVTIGDFNGDGNLDLVACSAGAAYLLLGDGKGNFGKPSSILPLGTGGCQQVLAADFNGDGKTDIVFRPPLGTFGTLVALGKGDGTFSTPQSVTQNEVFGVAMGDLNNDGILDLVLVEAFAVETLLGDGHAHFTSKGIFPAPGPTQFHPSLIPALGDFNGDGFLDVAVADEGNQITGILLGNGDGTFAAVQPFAGGGDESSALATGDFSGNGRTDLVLSGFDERTGKGVLTFLRNNTAK